MEWLIWIGTGFTGLGIMGLAWCIVKAVSARRQETDDAQLKARLQKVVALNLGALGVSAIGLMMVVLGVMLS
ncbi:MAG: hypothetical protein AAF566_08660 [Pseudomonadota bacterium]